MKRTELNYWTLFAEVGAGLAFIILSTLYVLHRAAQKTQSEINKNVARINEQRMHLEDQAESIVGLVGTSSLPADPEQTLRALAASGGIIGSVPAHAPAQTSSAESASAAPSSPEIVPWGKRAFSDEENDPQPVDEGGLQDLVWRNAPHNVHPMAGDRIDITTPSGQLITARVAGVIDEPGKPIWMISVFDADARPLTALIKQHAELRVSVR